MKATEYETGDRIYYTGDMANVPDKGVIIKKRPADRFASISYDVHLEDGRVIKGLCYLSFEPGPGRRFWLLSEWEADQKQKLDDLVKYMRKVEV
jgi:hypothetical protein